MKLRFRINTIMLILSYFCIFTSFPHFTYYNLVKYGCMVVVGFYIISNIRILKRKEFLTINIVLLAFSVVLLYTSWVNRSVLKLRDPFLASIVYLGTLIEFFLLMEITAVKGNVQYLVNTYFKITSIIVAIMDIMVFMGIQLSAEGGTKYLTGTKFQLVYAHFMLIAFYMSKCNSRDLISKESGFIVTLLVVLTLVISIISDCTTGITGIILLSVMMLIYRRNSTILHNPVVFVSVLLTSFLLSFALNTILLWNPVKYFVVEILDKDITLTSRTKIFMMVPRLLKDRYLLGYGYGTTYELGRRLGGFPNTQNALWEWIWQCGIIGTILLICLIFLVVRYANKSCKQTQDKRSKYVLMLLYLMSILAVIEITVDDAYLGYLAMLIPLTYPSKRGKTNLISL